MDIKGLKLELLERIAALGDGSLLLAVKQLLDAPRTYGLPNEHLSVVKEGQPAYLNIEDRTYTAEEVRNLLWELGRSIELEEDEIDEEEIAMLNERRERYLRGEERTYSVEEMLALLKKDLGE